MALNKPGEVITVNPDAPNPVYIQATPLERLSARFDVKEVKQRKQGGRNLDYISIDSTIRRLNDVLGTDWTTDAQSVHLVPLSDGTRYLASITLNLQALGKSAVGVGADIATDADKALKTALAEALKKAAHQFGVGLYLWSEDEREVVARDRAASSGDLNALKAKAFEKALEQGAEPNAESVAAKLGLTVEDLQDAAKLGKLLGV